VKTTPQKSAIKTIGSRPANGYGKQSINGGSRSDKIEFERFPKGPVNSYAVYATIEGGCVTAQGNHMRPDFALDGIHALVGPMPGKARANIATSPDLQASAPRPQHGPALISVEVAFGSRLPEIHCDWQSLIGRADAANVFMNPTLVWLAGESLAENRCRALLAWRRSGEAAQLVGVWAFAIGRAPQSVLPLTVLAAPAVPYGYLATPVIDRTCLDDVLDAMLSCIAEDASLPKIVALDSMGADGTVMQALSRVLAARGSVPRIFGQSLRPKLASELDGKAYLEKSLSTSSRKKLRQHRRRLAEKGDLQFRILREPDAVNRAFEDFLQLEASGWKGRNGTAVLSRAPDAAFARRMITALAAKGDASIHMLTLDDQPVSMQIVLRAGPAAFTWKTAYAETFHDFSPGALLLEDYTAAFLADDSIAYVDSCAFDDTGFMAAWSERQAIVQIWLDARRGRSLAFTVLSRLQTGYLALRQRAKTIYQTCIQARARGRTSNIRTRFLNHISSLAARLNAKCRKVGQI
jgi:CelD/BcsL family acetyltransferase involved in cellulose biosynthesis